MKKAVKGKIKPKKLNNFTKKDLVHPFIVQHTSGELKWVYAEDIGGFLHLNPLYPFIGINSPPAFYLKKPVWSRTIKEKKIKDYYGGTGIQ